MAPVKHNASYLHSKAKQGILHFVFSLPNHPSCTMALGLTQPLTEMSNGKSFLGGKAWPVGKADNLTTICGSSRKCGILNISQPYRPSFVCVPIPFCQNTSCEHLYCIL
jgi:hypothetical protein